MYEFIKKIVVEYKCKGKKQRTVYENETGINKISMIKYPKTASVAFYTFDDSEYRISFESFCKIISNNVSDVPAEDIKAASVLLDGYNYTSIIDSVEFIENECPYITYTDATEQILLGFPEITTEVIDENEKGLWSASGERLFSINVANLPFDISCCTASLVIEHYDTFSNDDDNVTWDPKPTGKIIKTDNGFLCSFDTDQIVSDYMDPEKPKQTISGVFALKIDGSSYGDTITFEFPFSFVLNNSGFYDPLNKYLCIDTKSVVSIDFGTSSTCAAIRSNGYSMIEMSLDIDGLSSYSIYENPTNIQMYNWKDFSVKWKAKKNQPLLRRYNTDHKEYSKALFDYGHNVKNFDIEDQRALDSIADQIKMIPQMIEDGKVFKLRDYSESEEFRLTSGENNSEGFDPIEFYGYLLGKAINHPNANDNRYYTKYILSYPVKFSDTIRKRIEASLKRGITRSLPSVVKDMTYNNKNLLRVEMKYSEPIASIGAVCGKGKELELIDGKPCLFGVFDFGGGTSDYAFGMYRSADENTEAYDEALELFGVDGDESFGGEKLISKISYWIMIHPDNKTTILDKMIPFVKPDDELMEDGYGGLISSGLAAIANIKKLNELISRPLFEGKKASEVTFKNDVCKEEDGRYIYQSKTKFPIKLFSNDPSNKTVDVDLNIDFDEIEENLNNIFTEKCKVFKASMDNAFGLADSLEKMKQFGASYAPENVKIIMAGNGSRHPMVRECLEKEDYSRENIFLIGEKNSDEQRNRYKITPKTAVAIGALRLSQMLVNEPEMISTIYVAVDIKDELTILLKGDMSDVSWHRAGVIDDGEYIVYTNSAPDTQNRRSWKNNILVFDDTPERMICFIRQNGRNSIEYIAVPVGADPNNGYDEYDIKEITLN